MAEPTFISEIFGSDEVGRAFMYTLVNNMLNDYEIIFENADTKDNENTDNYIVCNIYYYNQNTLDVRCMKDSIYLDFSYSSPLEKYYTNILKFHINKDNRENDCNSIAAQLYEHYTVISTDNNKLDYCNDCKLPYSRYRKNGKLFSNYCEKCEIINFFTKKKYAFNNIQCDICYNTKLDTINDMIYDRPFVEISCCKNKNICLYCRQKLFENKYNSNKEVKCPFCKQDLKTTCI
jgi:hypothetical protein